MTTKQYNTEDFVNAEFARHPDGSIAARFDDGDMPWRVTNGLWFSDYDMAADGWVPVREAAAQPITLDALRDAWEGAEVADEGNEGDILTHRHPTDPTERVEVWRSVMTGPIGPYTRVLHRAPKPKRPEGAEELEVLIRKLEKETAGKAKHVENVEGLVADWLAERGVRVTEEGEK